MDDVEARAYERAEGVAEWVRTYIMNPEAALTAAPKLQVLHAEDPGRAARGGSGILEGRSGFAGLRADKAIGANIPDGHPAPDLLEETRPWRRLAGDAFAGTVGRARTGHRRSGARFAGSVASVLRPRAD